MDWGKLLGTIDWKRVSIKKVGLNSLLGGLTVYGTLKGAGAPENYAIAGGLLSAVTSGGSAAVDTTKESLKTSPTPPSPAAPDQASEGEQPQP